MQPPQRLGMWSVEKKDIETGTGEREERLRGSSGRSSLSESGWAPGGRSDWFDYDRTVAIATLGCKVNQFESEALIESLEKRGVSDRSLR